ncbi:tripartite motif-containing protein 5-like isoform X1 [Eptesicus fuscus]|uniref:tripartite motif-containing protein 5-like isoform X1 n=1 Tax=Eptesicus fuscus TaxID=29078 RepID=UPI0024045C7D|nr:tripartite motif-containing protein 5-like isoform X1 [Eptesicus fuscus]
MASGVLMNIKEVVTCPICLEILTEPMSLDCGHSFCQACITANNKESMISEGESSCPVCRIRYQPENLRPSLHLANIVEVLREVKLSPEEEQKSDLCVHHGEKLLLFCQEHGKIICWLCERSQEHRGHHTFLMEEIAQEYKEKLQKALDSLIAKQQKAEKLGADLEEETTSWKNLIENESQSIQDYFKELRGILDHEEQKELQRLEEEESDVLSCLAQGGSELTKQSQLLRDLIWDLQCRLQGSTAKMLQDVNGILQRSMTFTLKKPETLSKKQRRVFQVPDLRGMLEVFNANVTLDRRRPKSNIAIPEDEREVRSEFGDYYQKARGPYEREDYDDYGVLGLPSITSGKHYWEVDVSQKSAWILGVCVGKYPWVCGGKYPSPIKMDFGKKGKNHQPVCSRYQPRNGYWVIGLQNYSEYQAFVDSASSNPSSLTLFLTIPPRRIGVFLDYNDCTISFLNITNHGFLIYKFSSCCFNREIYPYFNPMKCSDSLKLCSPSS